MHDSLLRSPSLEPLLESELIILPGPPMYLTRTAFPAKLSATYRSSLFLPVLLSRINVLLFYYVGESITRIPD